MLYKFLIRPLLEYCNTVWHPCHKQDSQELEKEQRRATKLVKNLRDMTLPSLVYRRKWADMLQMYRIVNKIDKLDKDNIVKMDLGERTIWHKFKHCKNRVITREKRNTLGSRAVKDWNTLSNYVVSAENLIQIKIRLEKEWNCNEYKFNPSSYY